MSRFKSYRPDQAYLLPPSVRDELGANHLCFFVRGVVERLDMSVFEQSYSVEGGELHAPRLMLGVWLYAYALGIASARQVERRLVEGLGFRYLAAGELNKALEELPRRLERLTESSLKKLSRTGEDARFLRQRGGFALGYAGEIAAPDDHLIVAQRVTQNLAGNHSLQPMIDQVRQRTTTMPDSNQQKTTPFKQGQRRSHADTLAPQLSIGLYWRS